MAMKNNQQYRRQNDSNEPQIPNDIEIEELPAEILEELKSLEKKNSIRVGKHILMANYLLETNPKLAFEHAMAAKNHAARIGIVREALGICAYRDQKWQLALSELRAAKRISGTCELDPLIADCLRAMKRYDQALQIVASIEPSQISLDNYIESQIIRAGALRDLDRTQEGIDLLGKLIKEQPALDITLKSRLIFAYADLLEIYGNLKDAEIWFNKLADLPINERELVKSRLEGLSKEKSNG